MRTGAAVLNYDNTAWLLSSLTALTAASPNHGPLTFLLGGLLMSAVQHMYRLGLVSRVLEDGFPDIRSPTRHDSAKSEAEAFNK